MAFAHLLTESGNTLTTESGAWIDLEPLQSIDTGGGGIALDLGRKHKRKERYEHRSLGGELLLPAGTRARLDALQAKLEKKEHAAAQRMVARNVDDELAMIFILSHL